MRSLLQPVIALLSVHIGTLLGGILLPIALTRFLGAEALGIFTSAASITLLILTIIDWGFETRLPILCAETPQFLHQHITQALRVKLLLWAVIVFLCVIGLLIAPSSVFSLPFFFYLLWACFRAVSTTFSSAMRGLERFSAIARIENTFTLLSYITALSVVIFGQNDIDVSIISLALKLSTTQILCGVIGCLTVGEIGKSVLLWRSLEVPILSAVPYQNVGKVKSSLLPGSSHLAFVIMQALSVLQSRAGIYALTLLGTEAELGYFSAVSRFTLAMRIIPGTLFNVLLPRFVRSTDSKLFRKVLLGGVGIGLSGSLILSVLAEFFILTIYGEKILFLAPLLRIAAWIFLLQTVVHILESYLLARQQEGFVNRSLLLGLSGFAVLSILLPANSASTAMYASLALESILIIANAWKIFILNGTRKKEKKPLE